MCTRSSACVQKLAASLLLQTVCFPVAFELARDTDSYCSFSISSTLHLLLRFVVITAVFGVCADDVLIHRYRSCDYRLSKWTCRGNSFGATSFQLTLYDCCCWKLVFAKRGEGESESAKNGPFATTFNFSLTGGFFSFALFNIPNDND